jgi:hypothetical protein
MMEMSSALQWAKTMLRRLDRRYLKGRMSLLQHASSWAEYRRILEVSEGPILIGGCGRSGTTLLLSLMSCHPNIYAFPWETIYFCPNVYEVGVEQSREYPFSIDLAYQKLSEASVALEKVNRWCEKTPMNVNFIDKYLDFFGDQFAFLNLVRDGRDVVTSHHPNDPNNYWVTPERWVRDVQAGKEWEDHPQVLTVRYEDLVRDHPAVMSRICDFIGEAYSPAFENFPDSSAIQQSRAWSGEASSVHQRSVKRWKKDEHEEVVEELMSTEGAPDLLQHYGYL